LNKRDKSLETATDEVRGDFLGEERLGEELEEDRLGERDRELIL
jgi:hypothetical protein